MGHCFTLLALQCAGLRAAARARAPGVCRLARAATTTTMLLGARAQKRWDARRVAADELDENESLLAGNGTDPIVQVDAEAPGDGVVFEALEGKLYRQYESRDHDAHRMDGRVGPAADRRGVRRRSDGSPPRRPSRPRGPSGTLAPIHRSAGGSPSQRLSGFRGVRDDLRRRFLPYYWADWRDGFTTKSIGAIAFLYFAVLAQRSRSAASCRRSPRVHLASWRVMRVRAPPPSHCSRSDPAPRRRSPPPPSARPRRSARAGYRAWRTRPHHGPADDVSRRRLTPSLAPSSSSPRGPSAFPAHVRVVWSVDRLAAGRSLVCERQWLDPILHTLHRRRSQRATEAIPPQIRGLDCSAPSQIFNALLALNFLTEGLRPLIREVSVSCGCAGPAPRRALSDVRACRSRKFAPVAAASAIAAAGGSPSAAARSACCRRARCFRLTRLCSRCCCVAASRASRARVSSHSLCAQRSLTLGPR